MIAKFVTEEVDIIFTKNHEWMFGNKCERNLSLNSSHTLCLYMLCFSCLRDNKVLPATLFIDQLPFYSWRFVLRCVCSFLVAFKWMRWKFLSKRQHDALCMFGYDSCVLPNVCLRSVDVWEIIAPIPKFLEGFVFPLRKRIFFFVTGNLLLRVPRAHVWKGHAGYESVQLCFPTKTRFETYLVLSACVLCSLRVCYTVERNLFKLDKILFENLYGQRNFQTKDKPCENVSLFRSDFRKMFSRTHYLELWCYSW